MARFVVQSGLCAWNIMTIVASMDNTSESMYATI